MQPRVPAAGQAQLSFARRAFLVSLIGICAVTSVSFLAVNLAIRTEIKAGIKETLQRTERSIEEARAAQNSRISLALRLVSGDSALRQAVNELERDGTGHAARAQARQIVKSHARTVREFTGSDFATLTGPRGNLLAEIDGPEPSRGTPAARYDDLASGLHSIAGTLYDLTRVPIEAEGRFIGAFTLGRRFDFAGLDRLGPAGLLYRGRLVRSTFSPARAAEAESRIHPDCARAGCELRIGG